MQARAIVSALILCTGLAATAQVAATEDAQAQRGRRMRFRAMDRDGDGVITRLEWRGNAQSFRQHDRNNDGVLSGDEVWVDAGPEGGGQSDLEDVFERADRDGDGLLSRPEWTADRATFDRVDRDNDGTISLGEFLGEPDEVGTTSVASFATLDRNGNGVITENEWTGARGTFLVVDTDNDGVITRQEYREHRQSQRDSAVDSRAFRAGRDRGLADGRQAGRQDREANRGWDLEGQRELEQADAGYNPVVGSRAEYQAGYRAGFRVGYREGFGPRR